MVSVSEPGEPGYHVVFVYTAACGGYEGVRTSSSWPDKLSFDAWYTDDIKKRERIVEEGVTRERALELISETPLACSVAAARQAATRSDGTIDPIALEMHLANVILTRMLEIRGTL